MESGMMQGRRPRGSFVRFVGFLVIIFAVVGAGVWFGTMTSGRGNEGVSRYSAVYLSSGDIYFGELTRFPSPRLKGVWLLRRGVDAQNQPLVDVVPFSDAVWGPSDEINLNERNILFWTKLRSDSRIVQILQNPAAYREAQAQASQRQLQQLQELQQAAPANTESE